MLLLEDYLDTILGGQGNITVVVLGRRPYDIARACVMDFKGGQCPKKVAWHGRKLFKVGRSP